MDQGYVTLVANTAQNFLSALHEALPHATGDRITQLPLSPTIFGSIGALAHDLVREQNEAVQRAEIGKRVDELRNVNWNKASHWVQVAGRYGKKGNRSWAERSNRFYAVLTALRDRTSPHYELIRSSQQAAAA